MVDFVRIVDLVRSAFNGITLVLLGGVIGTCILFGYDPRDISYGAHIALCVSGSMLLMPQAVLAFSDHNGWSQQISYKSKKTTHMVLNVLGSALLLAGSIVRIVEWDGDKFSTVHGIFGLMVTIMTAINVIGGFVTYFLKKPIQVLKISHAILGSLILIFAIITICVGVNNDERFPRILLHSGVKTIIVSCVIGVFGLLVTSSITSALFRRIGLSAKNDTVANENATETTTDI